MDCRQVIDGELVEKYLRAELEDDVRDAFEVHYLDCARCSAEVETWLVLRTELDRGGVSTARPGGVWWRRPAVLAPAVSAAVLVVAALWVGGWGRRPASEQPPRVADSGGAPSGSTAAPPVVPGPTGPPNAVAPAPAVPPTVDVTRLAPPLEPPAYEEVVVRGESDPATRLFRDAMRAYAAGDHARAVPGLEAAVAADPGAEPARFYLGACYLLVGQTDRAISTLGEVAGTPDSPFAEEARWYLAQALVRRGDLAAARAELERLDRPDGPWANEARRLAARLPAVK